MKRVVITGLGVTSCLGTDLETYWAALLSAQSAPLVVTDGNARIENELVYAIRGDAPPSPPPGIGLLGRSSQFAITAARSAFRDAGLDPDGYTGAGIAVGTGFGDTGLYEDAVAGHPMPSGDDAYPFKVSSVLACEFGFTGPTTSISTACSASAYGVSLAADLIRAGEADIMLAGGTDAYAQTGGACFKRMGALDSEVCRPFDARREGTVFGEGAAMMILESEDHARARGRLTDYGAVEGAGWSCDGYHPTAPDEGGRHIVRAMRDALADAAVAPGDVGCVVPHGTGTPLNDAVEGKALGEVFGDGPGSPCVYSLKAMVGHTAGAAGAFALLTGALIIKHGMVPANVKLREPDLSCGVTLHTDGPRPLPVSRVLINAYAFGGNNITVVIGR
ncbi:MAG TPA: beta-ketoacyl-[acyl-carrier-protein] synthase family protein [Candidatus Limnocylindrales bacterium]|nr:beta-ketoacyl-[acyl-carrier-protein] synthase family protein [Candidatus Limnocylindrales bacterium]